MEGRESESAPRGRFARWRDQRRQLAREAAERQARKRVKRCRAPRCWAQTVPGGDHCGLHQQL